MKRALATLLVLAAAVSLHAQGKVLFNNYVPISPYGSVNAPIRDAPENGGLLLSGATFLAQLYYAPGVVGDPFSPLFQPVGEIVSFRTGEFAGYLNVGSQGARVLPNVVPGTLATVEIRSWRAQDGATYEDVLTNPFGYIGESMPLAVFTGGFTDPDATIPSPPMPLVGLRGFSVHQVPEPSIGSLTVLLSVIGLIWRSRKKIAFRNILRKRASPGVEQPK